MLVSSWHCKKEARFETGADVATTIWEKNSQVSSLFWFTIFSQITIPKIKFTISNHYFFLKTLFGKKNHRLPHYFDSLFFKTHYFPHRCSHRKIILKNILPCLMPLLTGNSFFLENIHPPSPSENSKWKLGMLDICGSIQKHKMVGVAISFAATVLGQFEKPCKNCGALCHFPWLNKGDRPQATFPEARMDFFGGEQVLTDKSRQGWIDSDSEVPKLGAFLEES